jgi:DNA repair photolyase
MRRLDNPPNPFAREQREWLAAPPPTQLTVYAEPAGQVLTSNDSPDVPFRWSVNPYRGCQHACAYCYARRTHEYLGCGAGTDFETQIVVKVNAPAQLAAAFARRSWRREPVAFSGVTDCYQPLEAVYRLTRRCLTVCADYETPASVVTKAYLVVRDIDVLQTLHRRAGARVCFSVPFADPQRLRLVEPHVPAPDRQFSAMRQLADAGIPVGVFVAPVIPGLNDRDIPEILRRAAESGATTAALTPLRLPGNVREVFLQRIREVLPEAAKRIEERIRALRDGAYNVAAFGDRMSAHGEYWQSVLRLFETMATRYGLDAGQRWRRPEPLSGNQQARQLPLFE